MATPPLVFPAQLTGLTSQWRVSNLHYLGRMPRLLRASRYTLTTGTSRSCRPSGGQGIWTNAAIRHIVAPSTPHGHLLPARPVH